MTRSIAHLLLILLVLTCPVQCVITGDSCCASTPETASQNPLADAAETCSSTHSCCHHSASDVDSAGDVDARTGTDAQQTDAPVSNDDCWCDCLCKGAISSSVRIADEFESATLNSSAAGSTDDTDLSCCVAASLTDPPDPLSGREIRTLRMSFQV